MQPHANQRVKVLEMLERKLSDPNLNYSVPLPSEGELQQRLGVSRGTVRQALAELELQKRIYRVKGKGSFALPPGARSAKSIAFLLREPWKVSHFHNAEILRGMQKAVSARGTNLTLTSSIPGEWSAEFWDSLAGVVVLPRLLVDSDLHALRHSRVPFCMLMESDLTGPTIVEEVEQAAYELASRLISLGHRQIALISGHFEHSDRLKKRGIARAAEEANIDFRTWPDYCTNYDATLALEICQDVLRQKSKPSAFIGFDNVLAIQVIRAAKQYGLSVPNDISVVGFGGQDYSDLIEPALTTVNLHGEAAGQRAVELLYDLRIEPTSRISVGYDIVWGRSAGPVAV